MATTKGHIDCVHKNLRSTKAPHNNVDFNPPQEPKTHSFIGAITDLNNSTSKAYWYLTKKCSITSYTGMQYLFVAHHYNAKNTMVFPMKIKQTQNLHMS